MTASASAPSGTLIYAIGDLHGRTDLVTPILDHLADDVRRRRSAGGVRRVEVVLLGDYVDRGPDSRGLLARLIALAAGDDARCADLDVSGWVFLRGNHEQMLLDFLRDPFGRADWLERGGRVTVASYGLEADAARGAALVAGELGREMRDGHLDFLKRTRLLHRRGDYVFVHAGVRPGVPIGRQRAEDLMWIREPFLNHSDPHRDGRRIGWWPFGRAQRPTIVVHGHTPTRDPDFHPTQTAPVRVGIDTGAGLQGPACVLALWGDERTATVIGPRRSAT